MTESEETKGSEVATQNATEQHAGLSTVLSSAAESSIGVPKAMEPKGICGLEAPTSVPATRTREDFLEDRIRKSDRWIIALSAALVLFTAALVCVGGIQAWAFLESERAFIVPLQVNFGSNGFAADKHLQIIVSMQNTGRAPAIVTQSNVTVRIASSLPAIPEYFVTGAQSGGYIGAGGSRNLFLYEVDPSISAIDSDLFNAVQSGESKLYVFGFVEYEDDFSRFFGKKRVGYCSVYDPKNASGAGQFIDCANAENYVFLK